MDTYLIGLDCAAQHSKFGLALGSLGPSGIEIHKVETNNKNVFPVIGQWIKTYQPRILAFDAPLGWPATLGEALADHYAGGTLPFESDDALDAAICIMAAVDFAKETVYKPENIEVARKEGWIWFNQTKH